MTALLKLIPLVLLAMLVACTRPEPDHVVTFKSPTTGIFYTVETRFGQGAIDNDYTSVYLHLERSEKSVRQLVLSGTYVTVMKIEWTGPQESTIFFDSGFTDTFSNRVTLSLDGFSKTFHATLQEVQSPAVEQQVR